MFASLDFYLSSLALSQLMPVFLNEYVNVYRASFDMFCVFCSNIIVNDQSHEQKYVWYRMRPWSETILSARSLLS